jgi:hypothetical protein
LADSPRPGVVLGVEDDRLRRMPLPKPRPSPLQERKEQILFPPHFTRDIDHEFQLGPLLVFGEDVAFFGRGKTALRR